VIGYALGVAEIGLARLRETSIIILGNAGCNHLSIDYVQDLKSIPLLTKR